MADFRKWLLAFTITVSQTTPLFACVALTGERTFLRELNDEAKKSDFVALVEITKITDNRLCFPGEHLCIYVGIEVEVIEPITGSIHGQNIVAAKSKGSCSTDNDLIAGQQYYLAGEIIEDVLWSGPEGATAFQRTW